MRELHRLLLASESRELSDDIARLFDDIARSVERRMAAGETTPAIDVLETETSIEIDVDLPGVEPREVRVLVRNGVVIVAGEKLPRDADRRADGSFHLVERGFGRFARAVRLTGAFDAGRARARLHDGQLSIVIPKVGERRGREILVPVEEQDGR